MKPKPVCRGRVRRTDRRLRFQLSPAERRVGRRPGRRRGARKRAGRPSVPDARLHCSWREEDLQKSKALIGNDNERAASS